MSSLVCVSLFCDLQEIFESQLSSGSTFRIEFYSRAIKKKKNLMFAIIENNRTLEFSDL